MRAQIADWERAADRLWADAALDCRAAAQLVAEMARVDQGALGTAAGQALPSLRAALLKGAERHALDLARRRFGPVRDVLHSLDAPRFGKRRSPTHVLSPDAHHRRLLGLPSDQRLVGAEIQRA